MITDHAYSPHSVIEGKAQIGQRAADDLVRHAGGQTLSELNPAPLVHMNLGVVSDVAGIIVVPGCLKTIAIAEQQHH